MTPTSRSLPAALAAAALSLVALSAAADPLAPRVAVGLGASDFSGDDVDDPVALDGEYHFARRAIGEKFTWGPSFGALVTGNSDFWIGAGLSAEYAVTSNWFLEGSVMPGYYEASTEAADLGSDFEIRSLLGVGRRLTERSAVSIAISHLSNASIEDENPGANVYSLRYHFGF